MSKFARKFSLPHNDILRPIMDGPDNFLGFDNNTEGEEFFYTVIDNADQSYRDEIADIYFAKSFLYKFGGTTRRYGDVMGKEATDNQVDNLFKLQEKYDIPISLTINQEIHPVEILTSDVILNNFIKFIGEFYERGLRMCTISNMHLMGTGILQKNFPEMSWKNTVNHIVSNTQQMVDLIALGYNIVQLDRSLNRNISELRRCSKEAKKRGVITYLLASEGCMPHCPFKFEHDSAQPWIGSTTNSSYWSGLGNISCNKWRFNKLESHKAKNWSFHNANTLPRIGTSCVWDTNERFDMYNELVDVFKYSGRLGYPYAGSSPNSYACWKLNYGDTFYAKSFEDVYDLEVGILNNWNGLGCVITPSPDDREKYFVDHPPNRIRVKKYLAEEEHPFKTEEGIKMCKALPNCKNQCWNCHLCEDAYGLEHFDSLCEIDREPESGYAEKKDAYK